MTTYSIKYNTFCSGHAEIKFLAVYLKAPIILLLV